MFIETTNNEFIAKNKIVKIYRRNGAVYAIVENQQDAAVLFKAQRVSAEEAEILDRISELDGDATEINHLVTKAVARLIISVKQPELIFSETIYKMVFETYTQFLQDINRNKQIHEYAQREKRKN